MEQMGDHAAMMRHHMDAGSGSAPSLPGQDAFGAIGEIVRLLEADPRTDWSKVDLEALRHHLIDMNEVTLGSEVTMIPVEGGFEARIVGAGRTLAAIQRMVPAHAREIEATRLEGWSARTETIADGVVLTVTTTRRETGSGAADPKEVARLRGLGFIGVMVAGNHHAWHHLGMARGEMMH
jgi:hypothetical protein